MSSTPRPAAVPDSGRVHSLDAMRGYTMFLTISLAFLGDAIGSFPGFPGARLLLRQFQHAPWDGMTYVDLGFPLYILVMGIALRLGLDRARERGGTNGRLLLGVLQRSAVLFGLGFLCNGGFADPWPDVRILGVLQRLAICYLAGSIVFLHLGERMRAAVFAALLLGYWIMMKWIPVPGHGVGHFDPAGNLAAWVDGRFLPGRLSHGTWDSEGLLSTLPAIGTCVGGILLGKIFQTGWTARRRTLALAAVGVGGMVLGKAWAPWFPVNKYLWSSSYVLLAGGVACLHAVAFELVTGVWQRPRLVLPFLHYGRNSLAAYVGDQLLPFAAFGETLVGGSVALFLGRGAPLVMALVVVGLEWGILAQLYRRKIFIRL